MSKNASNLHSQTQEFEKQAGYYAKNHTTQKPLILAVETSGRTGSVAIALGEQLLAEAAFSGPMRHSAEIFPAVRGLLEHFGRRPKEIEHIYISIGPGSFTGLRIATTFAKTMHLASAAKIVAVDTLDVIAANAIDYPYTRGEKTAMEKIAPILDAKRGQFFIAVYQRQELTAENAENTSSLRSRASAEDGEKELKLNSALSANSAVTNWKKVFPDSLMTACQFLEKFAAADKPIWLLGEGLVYYKDKFKAEGIGFLDENYWSPRAEKVHLLGWKMALKGQFADALTLTPTYLRAPDAKVKQ